jgi:galactose mutarotase-like enzyme
LITENYKADKTTMAHSSPMAERVIWKGFGAYILRSAVLEVVVVPDLGAKVVSIRNLSTGREWMYHPNGSAHLFQNKLNDNFEQSPIVGWDECLPTISPCTWRGRSLPDHGEAWNAAWHLDEAAWKSGVIKTSVRLPVSPFEFTRAIEIRNDTLSVSYHLSNLSGDRQEFLWAMHPLVALKEGDRLVLSREVRQSIGPQPWLDSLDFEEKNPSSAKVFAGPLLQGHAEIFNPLTCDSLIFEWDAADCNTLGIWLTRGGWHGHHHVALEPSNGAPDSLAAAAVKGNNCGVLAPFGHKAWRVQIRATNNHRPSLATHSLAESKWAGATV